MQQSLQTRIDRMLQVGRSHRLYVIALVVAVFLFSAVAALADSLAAPDTVEVKGIEIFPGVDCQIGEATTCGVVFVGRPVDDRRGKATFTIRYSGSAGFGNTVEVHGGFWKVEYKGQTYGGMVGSGTVQWPSNDGIVGSCPVGVAKVSAHLNVIRKGSNIPATFEGCLNDLNPDGSIVIPPKISGVIARS